MPRADRLARTPARLRTALGCAALVLAPAAAAAAPFTLGVRIDLPTAINPVSAAVADVSGDGNPDIVVANDGSSSVSVLLGNGVGGFAGHVDYATGANPSSVAVGDLNGDGRPDLVTTNSNGNTLSVLLGTGGGAFASRIDYAAATHPECVVIADVNGDGYPDLVVANWGASTVSVFLGNGTGAFPGRIDYATGTNPYSVVVGDVNCDGNPDLVTVNEGSNTVSVLLGDGTGAFGAKTDFATGGSPISVALSDLNNDGNLDIATANYGAGVNTVSVMLGDGTGRFGPRTDLATLAGPGWVTIADADGDGKADLVVAEYGAGQVSEFPGDGAGGFGARVDIAVGTSSSTVAVADVNGDGYPDLVMPDYNAASATVLFGNGAGQFGAKRDFTIGTGPFGTGPNSVAIGDLNGDGKPDLVTATGSDSTVSVLLGNGDGTFGPHADFRTGNGPVSPQVADVNGDGKADIVVANASDNTVSVLLGNGAGGFGTRHDFATGFQPAWLAVADLNGDGKRDLVVANRGNSPFNDNTVSVLLGNGDGTFGAKTDFTTGPASALAVWVAIGDVNGDGKPDLAVANYSANTAAVLLGNGDGTFKARTEYATGTNPQSVAIGDVNGDGKPDLAISNGNSSSVSVLLGNGDGTFGARSDYGTLSGPQSAVIRDVSGDGRPDLVMTNWVFDKVAVMLGDGSGGFGPRTDITLCSAGGNTSVCGPQEVAVADVNGDGRPDLVTANQLANTVSVLLGLVPTRTVLTASPAPLMLGRSLHLVATVSVPPPGYGAPGDSVRFFDGTTLLGTAPVSAGTAVLVVPASRPGERALTAVYTGDGRFFGSISSAVPVRVNSFGHLAINFDFDPLGMAIPNGTDVDSTYIAWGVTFEKVGPGTTCGAGTQVYANATNHPAGFGSLPNLVSVCPPPTAADFSQNGFGMVHAMFAEPLNSVCIDVHPDSPTDFAVLQLYDASDVLLASASSAPGVTGPLCLSGSGIRGARFAGSGAHFATFDDLTLGFVTDRVDFDRTPAGLAIPPGAVVNNLYSAWGVTFEKSNLSTGCGFGANVYANSDQPAGFGSAPNVVSMCPPPRAADMSEAGVGTVHATFAQPYSRVCIDVRPDGASDLGVLRAYDAFDSLLASVTSAPGVTQQLCVEASGIRGVRFSGAGTQLARFDNLVFGGASVAGVPSPPAPTTLALASPFPNPTRSGVTVAFELPGAGAATLALYDVAGRVIESHDVGGLGPGRHVVTLGSARRLDPGYYLMRLRRGPESRTATAIVLR